MELDSDCLKANRTLSILSRADPGPAIDRPIKEPILLK